MEKRKGKKQSPSKPSSIQTWGEERLSSASELLESLDQMHLNNHHHHHHHPHRDLSSSEFLEILGKQGQFPRNMATEGSRSHHRSSIAIDQCNITSSLDYGSRDYYAPTHQTPYKYKENELDDQAHNACTDGNWWQGSLYY